MAALEKIRKRAAILTIVIGAGLLAFILEEAVRASGAFTTDTLAAKVGDEKIEMQEFQNLSQARQQQNNDTKTDPAVMQQQILQEIIQEKLLSQECDDANIIVSGNEVSELMVKNPPQAIAQICQQNGIDPKSLLDLLKNPNADPNDQSLQQVRAIYETEAQKLANQLMQAKLGMLLMGCLQANDVDIQLTKEESAVYDVTYAKVDYATVDDKNIKISDSDIQEAYNKYKEVFRLNEEARRVHYIKVDVDPSAKDNTAAAAKINKIYNTLQATPGISGVRSNSDVVLDSVTTTKNDRQVFTADGKNESKDAIFNTLIEGGLNSCQKKDPTGRDRNTMMYKVTSTYQSIDSIGLDMVMVQGPKARQDSVLALLKGGMAIDSLAGNPNIQIQKANAQNLMRPYYLPDSLRTKINSNAGGEYFTWQATNEGAMFAKVAQSIPATTFYNIARAKYVNYPSEETKTKLQEDLQKYLNKNKDIAAFEKNAKAAKYEVVEEVINPATTQLGAQRSQFGMMPGIPDSRKAVKWAFENKPGSISQIFADDNALVVIAVDEVYKDYMPVTDPTVKNQLTELIKSEKKGEYLMKQYKGKANNVAGYAALMKTNVDSASVSMGAPQQMLEGRVSGLIAGLGQKAQGKVQLVAGRNAFYAVQVNKINPARDLPKQQVAMQYRQQHFPIQQMLNAILQGSRKVKNNLIKFS